MDLSKVVADIGWKLVFDKIIIIRDGLNQLRTIEKSPAVCCFIYSGEVDIHQEVSILTEGF